MYKILTVMIPKISVRQTTIHTMMHVTMPTNFMSVDT